MKRRRLFQDQGRKPSQEPRTAGGSLGAKWVFLSAVSVVGAVLLFGAMFAPLWAQSYPNKAIKFVVPYAPGGTTDVLGRIVAKKLAEGLGQPVVPENRPGAGANVGTELVAKSDPDGHTLLITTAALTISPNLDKDLNFDPIKDFTPISLVGQIPLVLIVRPSLPVNNLKEFVEHAKANPGKLNYGSSGIGTTAQLASELFKSRAKVNITHVPYKGAGPMLIAVISGEVDMGLVGPPTGRCRRFGQAR